MKQSVLDYNNPTILGVERLITSVCYATKRAKSQSNYSGKGKFLPGQTVSFSSEAQVNSQLLVERMNKCIIGLKLSQNAEKIDKFLTLAQFHIWFQLYVK